MEEVFKIKRLGLFLGFLFLFFSFGTTAHAASIFFSPSSGSHLVGSTFATTVYVSSADQEMNASSGLITFPADKLEVTSLSKSGSIMSLWVQEPGFSNAAGTVTFEGIALNPGFTGSSGKIITINFRVKAAGAAPLGFSSSSVLANDGLGTNILSGIGSASFSLGGATPSVPEATTPVETGGVPGAPLITSTTHPDPNRWYNAKDTQFSWNLPSGITSARLLIGKIPQAIPIVDYVPAVSFKAVPDLEDGTWYFHVRLKNTAGWGGTSHFRVQIDTEKPDNFEIQEVTREDLSDPNVSFTFTANDNVSGIDHYEVQVDSGSSQNWQDDGSGIYVTPTLGPGEHVLIVKVVDRAGNSLANSTEFTIDALNWPIVTEYPERLQSGEILTIKGSTYPNAQVVLWLQRGKEDAKSYILDTDSEGRFTFIAEQKPKDGIYQMWAEVIDQRGARSELTKKVTIVVEQLAILRVGSIAVTLLSVIIPLIAMIILLLGLIWYSGHKFAALKRRIRKEVSNSEKVLHAAFVVLKKDVRDQIKLLEKAKGKRKLTADEAKVIKNLRKDLHNAEKSVKAEMAEIRKEVK